MSGGDVAPLEEQAVTELHKLFRPECSAMSGLRRPGGSTEVAEECSSLSTRSLETPRESISSQADAFLASRKNAGAAPVWGDFFGLGARKA